MSSCTVFVFLSLIEYAFVNVMMGDISEVERKDKASHLRNIIVTTNSMPYLHQPQQNNVQTKVGKCAHETEEVGDPLGRPS